MSAINSLAGAAATRSPSATGNGFDALSSDEFIRIMLTELTNQDPFQPNDSQAILEQLSSLRNIETQSTLQEQIESLVTQNAVSSAGGFIGRTVKGLDLNNREVEGPVRALRIESGKPLLVLDGGATIPADRVTDVQDIEDLEPRSLQSFLENLAILDSSGLIGKLVSGVDEGGQALEGVVTGVRVADGSVLLELDSGRAMPLSGVRRVAPAAPAAGEGE